MNVLCWNIRGISSSMSLLAHYCSIYRPCFLGILEPKSRFSGISSSFWRSLHLVPVHQNTRDRRRSNIWVFADPSLVPTVVFSSAQVVVIRCSLLGTLCTLAFTHAFCNYVERRQLWLDMIPFIGGPSLIIGDFNAVLGAHERRGRRVPASTPCDEFRAFIDAHDLIQPDTSGPFFTWTDRRRFPSPIESVLDRALFSQGFADIWYSSTSIVLPRLGSDHSPILLRCQDTANPPAGRRFRFLNMWCSHEGFLDQVRASWTLPLDYPCPMVRIMKKLKRLRPTLKTWNREVFGNYNTTLAELQQDLSSLQENIDEQGYTEDFFDQEVSLQARIGSTLMRKSEHLRQQSRVSWLSDGDRNTRFFHSMVKWRRSNQNIKQLSIDGVISEDPVVMANHVIQFYEDLFSEPVYAPVDRSWISGYVPASVTSAQADMLTAIPSADEIHSAVFAMDRHSAPGPDGFNGPFFSTRGRWWGRI
ncbi:uncharacterized protein LOC130993854 [Salvia miltiorrhiza]|uniref:uncharacterized protein LOC130993854 n=1 Tax=Salvia miltiorrhiza TaxID=226208 RepID=UPI0025ACB76A|nr:uncharacterized protein LOC130993854 [Salvia miltiorrhiza]